MYHYLDYILHDGTLQPISYYNIMMLLYITAYCTRVLSRLTCKPPGLQTSSQGQGKRENCLVDLSKTDTWFFGHWMLFLKDLMMGDW